MTKPFFSIVLCTRNRPDVLKHVLFSLYNQSFKDFEIILSDNSDSDFKQKNIKLLKNLHIDNLRYVSPNELMNMHDHYNYAIQHVSGEYIGILTDKNLLKKKALEILHGILNNTKLDILNYQHAGCLWHPNKFWKWVICFPNNKTNNEIEIFNPKEEVERRFSFKYNRSQSGKYYNFGKIFFGFYHKTLIQKVEKRYGKLFHALSPDYTSTILALNLCKDAAYYPGEIMVAINNYLGNGAKGAMIPGEIEKFVKSCFVDFEGFIPKLPIPHVYTLHNLCAYDYEILNRFDKTDYSINLHNLANNVTEDMKKFPYQDQKEYLKMLHHLNAFCKNHDISLDKSKIETQQDFNVKNYFLLNSLGRFLKRKGKIKKLQSVYKDFFSTHYRNLSYMLDQ